ncbi:transposase [Comamonas testosteroni]|uniref:IS66 family transposase n=1 Tax=Comamonas testosteroni TaxID=285 RepID=UPI00389A3651
MRRRKRQSLLGLRALRPCVRDFSGYKQFMVQGITEVRCLAHARRKFFDLPYTQFDRRGLLTLRQKTSVEAEVGCN